MTWQRRLRNAWVYAPYSFALAVALAVSGTLAIVYGDAVSQALSNIAADVVSRSMGGCFLVGGVALLAGVVRNSSLAQAVGLAAMSAGLGVYGLGVIFGLGLAGMVAGPICVALSIASIRRILTTAALAHRASGNGPAAGK